MGPNSLNGKCSEDLEESRWDYGTEGTWVSLNDHVEQNATSHNPPDCDVNRLSVQMSAQLIENALARRNPKKPGEKKVQVKS